MEPTRARGPLSVPVRALHRARRPFGVVGLVLALRAGRFAVEVAQGIRLLGYPRQDRRAGIADPQVWTAGDRVPGRMTSAPEPRDQDSEPPSPDGREPDPERLSQASEPGSHPDPDPGEGSEA